MRVLLGVVGLSTSADRIAEQLGRRPDILARVAVRLANLVADRGNRADFDTLPLNTNQLLLVGRALAAVELFMLAHEYGHQHYQHYRNQGAVNYNASSLRYEALTIAQEKEVDADLYGQQLMLTLADITFPRSPIDALVYKFGANVFLAVEGLMKKTRQSVNKDVEQLAVYPDPKKRLSFVSTITIKTTCEDSSLASLDFGLPYVVAEDVLWNTLENRFPLVYRELKNPSKNNVSR